jgi:two-component system copper resistance phosphate regulon response regulator CusR
MTNNAHALLLIEDDVSLAYRLAQGLRQEGYRVVTAVTVVDGLKAFAQEAFDLVLLDWMLPDGDGIEILKQLRRSGRTVPVLMLTARGETEDRVQGLDSGADDYLVKPFALAELLARIRSLLRRIIISRDKAVELGHVHIDLVTRRARVGGNEVDLTPREFDLLAYLVSLGGEVASRQMLVQNVWNAAGRFISLDNVIDVHIANLRRKLRDTAGLDPVETVRGVGYRIQSA